MMPYCQHKRCKRVADKYLGTMSVPDSAAKTGVNPFGIHDNTLYVCNKHYAKMLKLMGFKKELEILSGGK